MKNNIATVIVGLFLALPLHAFALAGQISGPEIALPSDLPEADRTNIMAAINDPDCKFLDGEFFNTYTFMRYGGDTKALNLFLARLAKCPKTELRITFSSEQSDGKDNVSWSVSQNGAAPGVLNIQIRLHAISIQPEKLVFPPIKGGL